MEWDAHQRERAALEENCRHLERRWRSEFKCSCNPTWGCTWVALLLCCLLHWRLCWRSRAAAATAAAATSGGDASGGNAAECTSSATH